MARKLPFPALNNLLVPTLVALLVISAFLVGSLWTKVSMLENGGTAVRSSTPGDTTAAQPSGPQPYQRTDAASLNIPEITDKDHIRGAKNAPLAWIEYSDLECPFCQRIHPDLQQLLSEYDGQVRWVYRHFPLDSLHSRARPSAEASECVASLGGEDTFWSFVDTLFEGAPASLADAGLAEAAASVGVNKGSFQSCADSGKFADRVQEDYDGGSAAGVNGTPGNFLVDDKGNAWVIPGAAPYSTIKSLVDEALAL